MANKRNEIKTWSGRVFILRAGIGVFTGGPGRHWPLRRTVHLTKIKLGGKGRQDRPQGGGGPCSPLFKTMFV